MTPTPRTSSVAPTPPFRNSSANRSTPPIRHTTTPDNVVLRLVHTEQVSYSSSGDIQTDLNRLQTPGDGFLDNVAGLRNTFGADLVSLISTPTFQGGLSNLINDVNSPLRQTLAFSVIN